MGVGLEYRGTPDLQKYEKKDVTALFTNNISHVPCPNGQKSEILRCNFSARKYSLFVSNFELLNEILKICSLHRFWVRFFIFFGKKNVELKQHF